MKGGRKRSFHVTALLVLDGFEKCSWPNIHEARELRMMVAPLIHDGISRQYKECFTRMPCKRKVEMFLFFLHASDGGDSPHLQVFISKTVTTLLPKGEKTKAFHCPSGKRGYFEKIIFFDVTINTATIRPQISWYGLCKKEKVKSSDERLCVSSKWTLCTS